MTKTERILAQILAEVVRLQRWAGGDAVSAARLFGLLHGFESVLDEERESAIGRATQDKVERMLEDVEMGKQSPDNLAIKGRLHQTKVSESDAGRIMQLCLLQSRLIEGIRKIAEAPGSRFTSLLRYFSEECEWRGALHYVELYDTTDGARRKLHGAFTAAIPREGEIVTPERGSPMRVVAVEYVVGKLDEKGESPYLLLMPHVILEAIDGE